MTSKIGNAATTAQPGGTFPGSGQGLQSPSATPRPIPRQKADYKSDNCNPQNEKARGGKY